MKVALLISGEIRGNWNDNKDRLRRCFPDADIYTSAWNAKKYGVDVDHEPEDFVPKMHYHPAIDVDPYPIHESRERSKNWLSGKGSFTTRFRELTAKQTVQILYHDQLIRRVTSDYDIIIRARWDTVVSEKIDWSKLVKKSFDENRAIGFDGSAVRNRDKVKKRHGNFSFDGLVEITTNNPTVSNEQTLDWAFRLQDQLIIHPRKLWNSNLVWKLHKNRKLQIGGIGWYQVLSEPYGDNHLCYYGGATIERYILESKKK
jgi:hypothetical protein